MRLSNYYLPLLKETPSDSVVKSHEYSLRAGLIKQVTSGIYTWLPIGLRVLRNIENIVRDELNKAGFIEILMPIVQPAFLWHRSERYNDYGKEMLRFSDRNDKELLFGPTHEELITDLISSTVNSYKNLPINLYQIGWKFRDELRPRSGLIRGREFLMKDAYSFDIDKKSSLINYNIILKTYIRIFKLLGLNPMAIRSNSGAIGGKFTHEFHIISTIGESTIYYDNKLNEIMNNETCDVDTINSVYTAADDMHEESISHTYKGKIISNRSIEIAQLFYLDDKYSKPFSACFQNNLGKNTNLKMGCYGIGISRLVGAIIEKFHDERGIKWPKGISPFKMSLINLYPKNERCYRVSEEIYTKFQSDILYDDKSDSSGIKFSRMDLLGIPLQIIIGKRYVESNTIELKNRETGQILMFSDKELISYINSQK